MTVAFTLFLSHCRWHRGKEDNIFLKLTESAKSYWSCGSAIYRDKIKNRKQGFQKNVYLHLLTNKDIPEFLPKLLNLKDIQINSKYGEKRRSLVHLAVMGKSKNTLKALLDARADFHQLDADKRSPEAYLNGPDEDSLMPLKRVFDLEPVIKTIDENPGDTAGFQALLTHVAANHTVEKLNYNLVDIIGKIDNIHAKIDKALSEEIDRLIGLNNQRRRRVLMHLQRKIKTTCTTLKNSFYEYAINPDWRWDTHLQQALEIDIKSVLDSPALKKYTDLQKFGIYLLNLITALIFPIAIIKYAMTGSAFFSTVEKSREVVENTLDICNQLKTAV
jgi:hypothetical protein